MLSGASADLVGVWCPSAAADAQMVHDASLEF